MDSALFIVDQSGLIDRTIGEDRGLLGRPALTGLSVFDLLLPAADNPDDWSRIWLRAPLGRPVRVVVDAISADDSVVRLALYVFRFRRRGEEAALCRAEVTDEPSSQWNPHAARFDAPEERLRCPNCAGRLLFLSRARRACECAVCRTRVVLPPPPRDSPRRSRRVGGARPPAR